MPEPHVVLELELPLDEPCPGDETLRKIEAVARGAVPLGSAARALTICSDRPGFRNKILTIGLWADDGGDSDAQLADALVGAGPLVPGRGNAALLISAAALQLMATASWSRVPKKIEVKIGFVLLSKTIDVVIQDGAIVTTVRGTWKKRFVSNVSFRVTVRELLSLRSPGSEPPLEVDAEKKIDPNTVKWAVVGTFVSPLLGALIFWKGDDVAESLSPSPPEGAGGALAARWPGHILTEIVPPDLPGKLAFQWMDLQVDPDGVRTLGIVLPVSRTPKVVIEGPATISATLPAHTARTTYSFATRDLRGHLDIQWSIDGVEAGRGAKQKVDFATVGGLDPGRVVRRVGIEVRDVDDLVANAEQRVIFDVKVPTGGQPF